MTQDVLSLAKNLLARPSVTPLDEGCQVVIAEKLKSLGFNIESMVFDDTTNLWARRGTKAPLFCFAGHTDVVPAGNLTDWHTPPFEPTVIDGYLYGRGSADMKGSLAAMLVATERFVSQHPHHHGSIAFLITSDEEGPFINGTTRVIDTLEARNEKINWAIVGEPSSTDKLGDIVKNGRRGSLTATLIVKGIQGHVAYPHLADNPIHKALAALDRLVKIKWDNGNEFFPATSMQIVNINGGAGASNVIPATLEVVFNFRYSTEVTAETLIQRVTDIFDADELDYTIDWVSSGLPFITEQGALLQATKGAIKEITGIETDLQTTGGTSDGRFIAPTGADVIELGPVNATIHKVNERVKVADLELLALCYQRILEKTAMPTAVANAELYGLDDRYLINYQGHQLEPDTAKAFAAMQVDARKDGIEIAIYSAYRSFDRQRAIWNAKATGTRPLLDQDNRPVSIDNLTKNKLIDLILTWSAIPGASRHHWGTDIDIFDSNKMKRQEIALITSDINQEALEMI